jgi:tetratricopeptide (TPR) repeat protein
MKFAAFVFVLGGTCAVVAAQPSRPGASERPGTPQASVAGAYEQFLLGHYLESDDSVEESIAAYKRAIELDPTAADIASELAALYLRHNREPEAIAAAELALKTAPANREAHRVLGFVYAGMAQMGRGGMVRSRQTPADPDENVATAIRHLEQAIDRPIGESDPNVRAMLSRLYVRAAAYDKAIPLLTELLSQEPSWSEGPALLAESFVGAGRNAEAIDWFERAAGSDPRLYGTLAEFYERDRRWKEAAGAFAAALQVAPRSTELKTRYASALLNSNVRTEAVKARDLLNEVLATRPNDARTLSLLSQAERRVGDFGAAEGTAQRLIKQNAGSPWGYYALAEAFAEQRQYQAVVDALGPAVAEFRSHSDGGNAELGLLLPHLGFAYQELRAYDKAIAAFEEAHRLAPTDVVITEYLVEANLAARRYAEAIDVARRARAGLPADLRLSRLEALALQRSGRAGEGLALLENMVRQHPGDPAAYISLARLCVDADRGARAIKVLQGAQARFPANTSVTFELGAALDKQKRYSDAEAVFRHLLETDADNAPALNYLGYMLAERGERLDESVAYVRRALEQEPDNGSYLDSLGWAYFKAARLDLAEDNVKRAAEQLKGNSVVQDHYGDILFALGRYDDAVAAWRCALAGDGDSIDRAEIERKIRVAQQKTGRR